MSGWRLQWRAGLALDYAVFSVTAPMIFLLLAKHSSGVCARNMADLDPRKYIASQLNIIPFGLATKAGNPGDEGQTKLPKATRATK